VALFEAVARRDAAAALAAVQQVAEQGQDLRQFCGLILEWLRHLTVAKLCGSHLKEADRALLLDLPEDEQQAVESLTARFTAEELQRLFLLWGRVAEELRGSLDPLFVIEMGVVRSTQLAALESFSTLLGKVAELEQRLGGAVDEPAREPAVMPQASQPAGRSIQSTIIPKASPSSPPSVPPAPSVTVPDHSAAWSALVNEATQQKPYLATYLTQARLLAVGERELQLGYPEKATLVADRLQTPSNREFLESAVARQFGRPLRVKLVAIPGETVATAQAAAGAATPSTADLPPLEPLLETVLDLFGGRVTSAPQPMVPPGRPARTPEP
jgi:DNA polymerase-3 subunit gamma/tau